MTNLYYNGFNYTVDLAAGVNTEFVKRITSSPTTVQKLTPLLPRFGYESEKTANQEEVVDTLISPAFQHALSSFCSAFPSGQLGPLVEQFEFGTDAVQAARSGNLEAFLNAIQKEADSKRTSEPAEVNPLFELDLLLANQTFKIYVNVF